MPIRISIITLDYGNTTTHSFPRSESFVIPILQLSKHEALALAAWLNRHTDKKKRQAFDYIAFSKKTKQPIRVPYICIASFLIMFPKYTKTTLLHEMAHCHLHVLGHPYVDHGRWFDSEIRRLYRYREVRGWV